MSCDILLSIPDDGKSELRLRSERKGGKMLVEMAESGERHNGHGDQKSDSRDASPKLSDLGINYSQSSRWQMLAGLPDGR